MESPENFDAFRATLLNLIEGFKTQTANLNTNLQPLLNELRAYRALGDYESLVRHVYFLKEMLEEMLERNPPSDVTLEFLARTYLQSKRKVDTLLLEHRDTADLKRILGRDLEWFNGLEENFQLPSS